MKDTYFYISIPDEKIQEESGEDSDINSYLNNKEDYIKAFKRIIKNLKGKYENIDIQLSAWNKED